MAQQIIKIELGDGKKIVAEPNWDDMYKELCVWLEDEDGNMIQDLAIIGEDYKYCEDAVADGSGYIGYNKPIHDNYYICVYGDENDEDYTQKIRVKAYKPQEE